jgi:hypothetical protein
MARMAAHRSEGWRIERRMRLAGAPLYAPSVSDMRRYMRHKRSLWRTGCAFSAREPANEPANGPEKRRANPGIRRTNPAKGERTQGYVLSHPASAGGHFAACCGWRIGWRWRRPTRAIEKSPFEPKAVDGWQEIGYKSYNDDAALLRPMVPPGRLG